MKINKGGLIRRAAPDVLRDPVLLLAGEVPEEFETHWDLVMGFAGRWKTIDGPELTMTGLLLDNFDAMLREKRAALCIHSGELMMPFFVEASAHASEGGPEEYRLPCMAIHFLFPLLGFHYDTLEIAGNIVAVARTCELWHEGLFGTLEPDNKVPPEIDRLVGEAVAVFEEEVQQKSHEKCPCDRCQAKAKEQRHE